MKKLAFVPIMVWLGLFGCKRVDVEKNTPRCVRQKVESFNKQACKEGAAAREYRFQQKTVYVLDPGNCGNDLTAEVIDAECNSLGFLGGIIGNTKINGEEFANATLVRTVWEK